jgi:hypothetical protein
MIRNNSLLFYAGLIVMIHANGMDNYPILRKFKQEQRDIFSLSQHERDQVIEELQRLNALQSAKLESQIFLNQALLDKAALEKEKKQNDEEFATDYRCRVFNTQQLLKSCEKEFEKRKVEKDKQLTRR